MRGAFQLRRSRRSDFHRRIEVDDRVVPFTVGAQRPLPAMRRPVLGMHVFDSCARLLAAIECAGLLIEHTGRSRVSLIVSAVLRKENSAQAVKSYQQNPEELEGLK